MNEKKSFRLYYFPSCCCIINPALVGISFKKENLCLQPNSYKIQLTIIRFLPLKSISYNLVFQLIIKIVYLSRALPNYKRSSKYITQHPLKLPYVHVYDV